MPKILIPMVAALLGAFALFGSGAFADRHTQSGDAFLALLYASHAAAAAAEAADATH